MQYCEKCRAQILGEKQMCPLCQGELSGTPERETEAYPQVPDPKYSAGFLLRLISFAAIVAIVVSFTVNWLVPTQVMWCWFVIGGVVCAWITASVGIVKRRNVLKNISWQVVLVSLLAVGWDYCTTWRGWSLDYAIPGICFAAMVAMTFFSKLTKLPVEEYLVYLILCALYSLLPLIFLLTGSLRVVYPSAICVAVSIISLASLFIFEGTALRNEILRRLHL